jgi:rhamnulokinase
VTSDHARAYDLTNERGIDGSIRLLKNVMGLWLVQECRRAWGSEYDELGRLASAVDGEVPLFDPDREEFLAPGTDMPDRIAAASGAPRERPPGVVVRSILTSLACKYRLVLERLEHATGRRIDCVNVIGGGARNELLCRLTADVLGRRVVSGPVEATALGNLLVQARAAGELATRDDIRAIARASAAPDVYEPADAAAGDATYQRFLAVTGLKVENPTVAATPA